MDNQEEIQHGCPGVLGFIFYIGQPMNPHGELDFFFLTDNKEFKGVLGFIFYNGQPRIRISRCTGFYFL